MTKIISLLFCLFLIAFATVAQESPDFSGTYTLRAQDGQSAPKKLPKVTLKVVQNSNSLEVVESFDEGKPVTRRYTLGGGQTMNFTSAGVPTTDEVETKGKTLVIRSSFRLPTGTIVHETQKWELSADLKTLKIRRQTEFDGMSMLDDMMYEKYQRQ